LSLATLRENSMIGGNFSPGDLVEFNAPRADDTQVC
jgi:FKBP-type peptidyl-prolyl cis-trans isomerase SlpA